MDIINKHSIEFEEGVHYYKVPIEKKEFFLDYSSPLKIHIDDKYIYDNKWVLMLFTITNYLIKNYDVKKNYLLKYQAYWSKKIIFSEIKNDGFFMGPLLNGLYINSNHSSTHIMWLIQDLIEKFRQKTKDCYIWIKKPPAIESKEVVDYFYNTYMRDFKYFLLKRLHLQEEKINDILNSLNKIDILFAKISPSQKSLILIESKREYGSYKSRLKKYVEASNMDGRYKEIIYKILNLLTEYHAYRHDKNILL